MTDVMELACFSVMDGVMGGETAVSPRKNVSFAHTVAKNHVSARELHIYYAL